MKPHIPALLLLFCSSLLASLPAGALQRETISVVGSSTVYPFTTVVAERFGRNTVFKTPKIESTGTGGGLKMFCSNSGVNSPDMANASRPMKKSEFEVCQRNGVKGITEVILGYDGIVLANTKKSIKLSLTRQELFLALAKFVPVTASNRHTTDPANNDSGDERLIPNPYQTWQEINPNLPAHKIEVLGPPPTSGTRDAFSELVLEGGCRRFAWINALAKTDPKQFKQICHGIREDQKFIEAGENDNLIVRKLMNNANALGIFGFSFLDQNIDRLQPVAIDGSDPDFANIANGQYAISRPLYIYVKNSHVDMVPGIREFLQEFMSFSAMGSEGYLAEKGLIPISTEQLEQVRKDVLALKRLAL